MREGAILDRTGTITDFVEALEEALLDINMCDPKPPCTVGGISEQLIEMDTCVKIVVTIICVDSRHR